MRNRKKIEYSSLFLLQIYLNLVVLFQEINLKSYWLSPFANDDLTVRLNSAKKLQNSKMTTLPKGARGGQIKHVFVGPTGKRVGQGLEYYLDEDQIRAMFSK